MICHSGYVTVWYLCLQTIQKLAANLEIRKTVFCYRRIWTMDRVLASTLQHRKV